MQASKVHAFFKSLERFMVCLKHAGCRGGSLKLVDYNFLTVCCIGLTASMMLLVSSLPGFSQGIGAFSGFKSGGKSPIQIEADQLEIIDKSAIAIFQGNVKVVQGKSLLKADKLKVYYLKSKKNGKKNKNIGNNNSIKRLEVSGTVYIKSEENEATSDRGSFNMLTEDVELIGSVVLSQGKNIMTGCRFRANLKTGIATMISNCDGKKNSKTGRVKMLLEPSSAKKKK